MSKKRVSLLFVVKQIFDPDVDDVTRKIKHTTRFNICDKSHLLKYELQVARGIKFWKLSGCINKFHFYP